MFTTEACGGFFEGEAHLGPAETGLTLALEA